MSFLYVIDSRLGAFLFCLGLGEEGGGCTEGSPLQRETKECGATGREVLLSVTVSLSINI